MSASIVVDHLKEDELARAVIVNSYHLTQTYSHHEEAIITQAEQTLSTSKDKAEIIDESPFFQVCEHKGWSWNWDMHRGGSNKP